MKKHLLILILLFTSNILYAGEIKLSCDVNLTISYASGNEENKKIHEMYIINEFSYFTSILPASNSGNLPSVVTKVKVGTVDSVINNSDENRWDIINTVTRNGNFHKVSVVIDRNSGSIYTSHDMKSKDNVITSFIGTGNCEKVDTVKKKF